MLLVSPLLRYVENEDVRKQYEFIERNWENDRFCIQTSCEVIQPFPKEVCLINKELNNWLIWVNKNITLHLASDTYRTTDVKLRIATGMLNKITSVDDIKKMLIHDNLTMNVNSEMNKIALSDLPF